VGRPLGQLLAPIPTNFPDLLLHQQFHQLQSGLADQFAHALAFAAGICRPAAGQHLER
jgi:hypothetical protein